MKIEKTVIFGFVPAFRGLRNPMDSWSQSDSNFFAGWDEIPDVHRYYPYLLNDYDALVPETPFLGPKDLKLAYKLIKGGSEHRKFLRQIVIWADVTLPRYVFTELDTYKVATVRSSCSTMHKLGHTDLSTSDFQDGRVHPAILELLNSAGKAFRNKETLSVYDGRELSGYNLVRFMKQHLPEGFLQKATYSMNYETALSMYFQRRNHRLPEWNEKNKESITSFIRSLPYMDKFILAAEK